jgi:hypothetical protein
VGWELTKLRLEGDVTDARHALQPWERFADHSEYIVKVLLWPSESGASAIELESMNKRLTDLGHAIREASDSRQNYKHRLEEVETALRQVIAVSEKRELRNERAKRFLEWESADEECKSLNEQRTLLDRALKDGHAHFARSELVAFCKSSRCKLNPLKTANALAGLPFIGWRRSAKVCAESRYEIGGSLPYQIFKVIDRIINNRPWGTELIEFVKQNLTPKKSSEREAISELRRNWTFLKEAIATVLRDGSVRPLQRPYKMASEYIGRTGNLSLAAILLAERESLPPLET